MKLRLYGKKRGTRYSGPTRGADAWRAAYFSAFVLLGVAFFLGISSAVTVPEWRVYNDFREHTCVVRGKQLGYSERETEIRYRPELLIDYEVGERRYSTWTYDITGAYVADKDACAAVLDRFEIGNEYPCWYNPHDPRQAVLVQSFTWFGWLLLIVPATFTTVGGAGLAYTLAYWGTSAERRAVIAQASNKLDLLEDDAAPFSPDLPFVPTFVNYVNSRGTTLKYRLPPVTGGRNLIVLLLFCIAWNAIASVLVIMAIRSHLDGHPEWLLWVFATPLLAVGLGLIVAFVRQCLVDAGIGTTIVEISDYPLQPGEYYELLVWQAGWLTANSFRVVLACDEQATYRAGTDTRTRSLRVVEEVVYQRENFVVTPDTPLEIRCPLQIPEGAMHSFQASYNQVQWKLILEGNIARWPDFERIYALHVYPQPVGSLP